ncbi:MAG: dTDP-4-dehydrorhamnose 3,5-epimerase [Muribaculaceae bacterium]|nr:dTDP-4-dehydrorhamnose 3,5-epimerase [Muribaculaceae bacterium]
MNIIETPIKGVLIVEPRIFRDGRGYFFESYSQRDFNEQASPLVGYDVSFVQDNEALSTRGVVRGLHFQSPPFAQSKLVRCVEGRVLDVAVDLRSGSPTYGKHLAVELSGENHRQLFIPRGFAHGYSVLSERALFQYKCDAFYAPESEGGISALDPALGIDWGLPESEMILSEKDQHRLTLADFDTPFL